MDQNGEAKSVELKKMLIDVNILGNKSHADWKEYKRRNDEKWIAKEGLAILLTEEMVDLMVNKSEKEVSEIFDYFIFSSATLSCAVQCSLVQLCTSVSDRVVRGGSGWKGLRVVCWVVGRMAWKYRIEWSEEAIDCVVDYLVKVIEECEDMEMVKWAVLAAEMWWVKMKMKMNSERRNRLRTAITLHSQTHSDTLLETMDRLDLWDAERYQVGWCARWCLDNVFEVGVEKIPLVKLSRDRLEARCDDRIRSPVRSPFPVKSNVYFYEVTCVTNGNIQLGWTTRNSRFDYKFGIISNKHSVRLEVGNQCVMQQNGESHPIPNPYLRSFNVVGCLLDMNNQRFEFYLNGQSIYCRKTQHFTPPYFATVCLFPHQQCHFNFGQCLFKFPPRNIRFTTFHEQTGGDERKYRLGVTKRWSFDYWFLHPPVGNQVSLFFDDELQNEVNREVRRVEREIENDRDIGEWRGNDHGDCGGYVEFRGLRYMQSIIEVMAKVDGGNKVEVMAQWIGRVIGDVIDEINNCKLLELLYPYLHLYPTQSTLTQHRFICIVLLHLIKCCRHQGYRFIQHIHWSVFTYLTRTLTSSTDHWTQLFVLIALADLEMSETEKKQIEGCAKIGQIVETCRETFEGKDVGQLIKKRHEHRILYQLYLCSHKMTNSSTPLSPNNHASLNPHDLTPQLTLSPCHLSARSDWHWQSVRSVCQVSAHIYYFEVVLLTAGPMTLGWATKRTDLTKIYQIHPKGTTPIMVGFDEFCIGFDGFNRCIYHDNKTFQLDNIPRWKAGDIVGCLIDPTKKRFHFYLNGIQINFNPSQCPIFFSTQPYYSFLSLSQLQQVYLNFGQSPFLHRPKYIDFCDFYSDKPEVNEKQTKTVVNFNNSHLNKNMITIDANINQRDVTITDRAATMEKSIQSTESIGNISSIHTIGNVNVDQVNSRMECRLCCSSSATKLVRFVCCEMLPLCLDCLRVMTECPKCKKQNNDSQLDENQANESKQVHHCTLCSKQRASFRFISCDHFNLCQTCVNLVLFKDCPKCN